MSIGFIVIALSCVDERQREIRSVLRSFMKSTVDLPDSLLKIEGGVEQNVFIEKSKRPIFVIYLSRNNCHECSIEHLEIYANLYELSEKESSFDVMTIFSPYQANYIEIRKLLLAKGISFPVFVDRKDVLESQEVIPPDSKYHMFLLSADGRPIFVGNPYISKKILNKFLDIARNYN